MTRCRRVRGGSGPDGVLFCGAVTTGGPRIECNENNFGPRREHRMASRRSAIRRARDEEGLEVKITADGRREWRKNGLPHRDVKPAVICADGTRVWYKDGLFHRDNDKPAFIFDGGTRCWYVGGQRHRDGDQPAVSRRDGTRIWYVGGVKHRAGARPAEITPDGGRVWHTDRRQRNEEIGRAAARKGLRRKGLRL